MELTTLLGTPPFQGLAEEDLAAFLFGSPNSLRRFNPGEFVALQGDLCRGLYVLAAGTVRAGMLGGEGKELTVEEIQAPALLASAFIFATESRFPVQVEAVTACEIFVIGKERFLDFMQRHPSVMRDFLRDISDRSVFLSRKLNEFALLDLKRRILKYLETHPGVYNQREVAKKLGVTRPSLARALSELAREGKAHGVKP